MLHVYQSDRDTKALDQWMTLDSTHTWLCSVPDLSWLPIKGFNSLLSHSVSTEQAYFHNDVTRVSYDSPPSNCMPMVVSLPRSLIYTI